MLNKLLDEPHFSGLDLLVEKNVQRYPCKVFTDPDYGFTLSSVMPFLTNTLNRNAHPGNDPGIIKEWIEEHLQEVKTQYLFHINNLIGREENLFSASLLEKRRWIQNSNDLKEIHDYYMTLRDIKIARNKNAS